MTDEELDRIDRLAPLLQPEEDDQIRDDVLAVADALARVTAERDDLSRRAREVTCVWCGHQFESTLQTQAAHLYAHAKVCEQHPVRKAEAERDKLQAFKVYVHTRLDAMGVPADPESPHRADGCRVGGRLDWVAEGLRVAVAYSKAAATSAAFEADAGCLDILAARRADRLPGEQRQEGGRP